MHRRRIPSHGIALALILHAFLDPASRSVAQESRLESLRTAATAAPNDYDAQRALGLALLEAGRYREATAQLRRASGLRRDDARALYEIALVDFAERAHERARGQCRSVARLDAVLGRVCEARAFLAWSRSARAFEELEAALAQAPTHYEALLALGEAHRLRADVAAAESAYRRAAASDPQQADPHLGLGQLYAQAGRRDDALAALRRARELAPEDPDVAHELGRLLDGEEGLSFLREAVANRPSWAAAHASLGDALLRAGTYDDAAASFRAALEREANLPSARTGLGRALLGAGQLPQAEAALREALAQVANDPSAMSALADVLARSGRADEAFEQYRHAADLDPRSTEALLHAAELAISLERPTLAAGYLQRALARAPSSAAVLAMMGDLARARRDVPEASRLYQQALQGEGPLDREQVQRALRELR